MKASSLNTDVPARHLDAKGLPSSSPAQDRAVAARYGGNAHPFNAQPLDVENQRDLALWVKQGALVALVDDAAGGIIGYVHQAHADRIAGLLNVATL